MDWIEVVIVLATGFVAATLGSLTGAGVTVVLLPVLIFFLGIRMASPVETLALVASTLGRTWLYRREIVLPVVGWFVLGGLPSVLLGTLLFTRSSPELLTRLFGVFLLLMVLWRRFAPQPPEKHAAAWFLPIGLVLGFLQGITSGLGSMMAPFYLAFGLRKGAYVGTAALGALIIILSKLAVFGQQAFLTREVLLYGFMLFPAIFAGSWFGRVIMNRISERAFVVLIEVLMVVSGLLFLFR